jgi:hypothetical protein
MLLKLIAFLAFLGVGLLLLVAWINIRHADKKQRAKRNE